MKATRRKPSDRARTRSWADPAQTRSSLFDRLLVTNQSFLIYGPTLPLAALLEKTRRCTRAKVVDLRDDRESKPAIDHGAAAVVLLGAETEAEDRARVLELLDAGRVIAFCSGCSTVPEIGHAFGTVLAAAPALRMREAEVK